MYLLQLYRSLSHALKLLLINDFSINIGFFMLYPYLTVYFRDELGFPAWMIGLILGVRVLSQQGLTIFGGTLADRLGYKPIILTGLTVRTVGFGMLGFADSFPLVLIAAILSGLGGSLFTPSMRAYIAAESKGRRAEVFALDNVFGQAGVVLGPLVGLLLLGVSFRWVAIGASAVFFTLMVLQAFILPARVDREVENRPSVIAGWAEVFRNRTFLLFSATMFAQFTLHNQLYLGIPLQIERLTGGQSGISFIFLITSLFTISLQVSVTAFCKARWRPLHAISAGLLLLGCSFIPQLITEFLLSGGVLHATDTPPGVLMTALLLTPALATALLLALGAMVSNPFALEMVPRLGKDRLTAVYFGAYSMAAGIGAMAGNTLTGVAFDAQDALGIPGLPWLLLMGIGITCAVSMRLLSRRREFAEPARPAPSVA